MEKQMLGPLGLRNIISILLELRHETGAIKVIFQNSLIVHTDLGKLSCSHLL